MLNEVYNRRIIELAGNIPRLGRLAQPDATATDPRDAGEPRPDDSAPELQVARYDLKLALSATADGTREEQLRVAEILRTAAADIRGK